jgi:hypothetical protein
MGGDVAARFGFVLAMLAVVRTAGAQDVIARSGPIESAIIRAAERLARIAQAPSAESGWSRVTSVAAGTTIVVATISFAGRCTLVKADDTGLLVSDLGNHGSNVDRIDRRDVLSVELPKTRASAAAIVGGIAAGFGAGYITMMTAMDCPTAGNCAGWRLRQSALFWLPAAGGFLGFWATRHEVTETIYHASAFRARPGAPGTDRAALFVLGTARSTRRAGGERSPHPALLFALRSARELPSAVSSSEARPTGG